MGNSESTPQPAGGERADLAAWIQSVFADMKIAPGSQSKDGVLDSVIRSTAARQNAAPDAPEFLQAMRAVAQRHKGQPFSIDPIAIEMVQGVLAISISAKQNSPFWHAAAREIASSLCDDPDALSKLQSLWLQLGQLP